MTTDSTKTIDDLRNALFSTLEALKDGTMPIDQARAINDVAQTLVATAKVEIDYLRVSNQDESKFLKPPAGRSEELPAGVTRHRLVG